LIVTGDEHFALTDHGSFGIAWLQSSVSDTQADLDVTAQISNPQKRTNHLTVVANLLDAGGNLVTSDKQEFVAARNVTAPYFLHLTVPNPHLWNGRKDPYLYHAVVELHQGDAVVDAVTNEIGLRYYHVDPDKGFFLNGQLYDLHGVDKHQERLGKGWAVSNTDLDEDMAIVKELGVTVIRCAHYEHPDYWYTLCDRAGILAWAEIPQVDKINTSVEFENNSRSQLLDLIRQNVNHPPSSSGASSTKFVTARPTRTACCKTSRLSPAGRPHPTHHCRHMHRGLSPNEPRSRSPRLEYLSRLVRRLGHQGGFHAHLGKGPLYEPVRRVLRK